MVLERPEGKILITGDSLQNFDAVDENFNFLGGVVMKMMGFIKPFNVGPAWKQVVQVEAKEMKRLLNLKFDHVLPGHGSPVIGQAWKKYEPSILSLQN